VVRASLSNFKLHFYEQYCATHVLSQLTDGRRLIIDLFGLARGVILSHGNGETPFPDTCMPCVRTRLYKCSFVIVPDVLIVSLRIIVVCTSV
jgi:hypothetical protein